MSKTAMNYFLIKDAADGCQCRVYSATTASGQPICNLPPEALSNLVASCEAVEKRHVSDKLFSIGKDFVVSERTREVFSAARLGADILWVPAAVHNTAAAHEVRCYVVRSYVQYDVVDMERSKYNYFRTDPTVRAGVKEYVFRHDALPDRDLFLTTDDDWRWIATETLVELAAEARLTGFHFVPIWSG